MGSRIIGAITGGWAGDRASVPVCKCSTRDSQALLTRARPGGRADTAAAQQAADATYAAAAGLTQMRSDTSTQITAIQARADQVAAAAQARHTADTEISPALRAETERTRPVRAAADGLTIGVIGSGADGFNRGDELVAAERHVDYGRRSILFQEDP